MDIEACRNYCLLAHKGVTEETPFGPDDLVFKVMGKMFALLDIQKVPHHLALKCDPNKAVELREQYDGVITGAYHMNKKHWNSLTIEVLHENMVKELIDHSYELVVQGLPKKVQQELKNL